MYIDGETISSCSYAWHGIGIIIFYGGFWRVKDRSFWGHISIECRTAGLITLAYRIDMNTEQQKQSKGVAGFTRMPRWGGSLAYKSKRARINWL